MISTLTRHPIAPVKPMTPTRRTNRTLSIAHVPRRFVTEFWGGTETVILETAREQARRGHAPWILTTNALKGSPAETIDGIPIERHPYLYPYLGLDARARRRLDDKGGNLVSLGVFRALMRRPGLDLIHLHTGKRLGGIARTAARMRGLPYVVTLHGGAYDVPPAEAAALVDPTRGSLEWGRALGWLLGSRRVLRDADAIICVGGAEAEKVRAEFPGQRVVHLGNGVDVGRFETGDRARFRARHGIPEEAHLILNVGRIDPQKNQVMLLDALDALLARPGSAESRPLHLALMGPVTDRDYALQIRQRIQDPRLAGRVHLLPPADHGSSELSDAYHAADLFVLSSRHEPFGIVILEAWAAGTPVIATRVGGIPSFVKDGEDGVLTAPESSLELAHRITRLLDDRSERFRLARSARTRVGREFDWSHRTDVLDDLYQEVLDARARR